MTLEQAVVFETSLNSPYYHFAIVLESCHWKWRISQINHFFCNSFKASCHLSMSRKSFFQDFKAVYEIWKQSVSQGSTFQLGINDLKNWSRRKIFPMMVIYADKLQWIVQFLLSRHRIPIISYCRYRSGIMLTIMMHLNQADIKTYYISYLWYHKESDSSIHTHKYPRDRLREKCLRASEKGEFFNRAQGKLFVLKTHENQFCISWNRLAAIIISAELHRAVLTASGNFFFFFFCILQQVADMSMTRSRKCR